MVKNSSPDPPFISHYAIIQGEIGIFLTFSVFELQRGYLYQNGVEFRQKVIGAGLNLFWGHLHYFSGGIWTFPLLSDTYASAPIAEHAIQKHFQKVKHLHKQKCDGSQDYYIGSKSVFQKYFQKAKQLHK